MRQGLECLVPDEAGNFVYEAVLVVAAEATATDAAARARVDKCILLVEQ